MKRACSLRVGFLIAMAAACTSAPIHYHTLTPAPVDAAGAIPPSADGVALVSVKIPAQVDRPELVVRQRNGEIALLENEEWIAPPAEELRTALSIELVRQLTSADARGLRRDPPPIMVRVEIERFESAPGDYVLVTAFWHLRINAGPGQEVLACRTEVNERVANGIPALVRGYQLAIASIADTIASAALRSDAENGTGCPATGSLATPRSAGDHR
ncbi:MAG TPA: PqiC family protein [Steroidobacteraceae bacterium]|nr:PqiC family protein [Steroidobacteraceae bacterium]